MPAIRAPRFIWQTASSFIAGKHRSHREIRSLLERGLPAKAIAQFVWHNASTSSRASTAPTGKFDLCWSEACPRRPLRSLSGTTHRLLRGQAPLQQGYLVLFCRSELARDPVRSAGNGYSSKPIEGRTDLIASKLAPTKLSTAVKSLCRVEARHRSLHGYFAVPRNHRSGTTSTHRPAHSNKAVAGWRTAPQYRSGLCCASRP